MSGELPKGWAVVRLGDLGLGRSESIEPSETPDIEFESWSVPAFPSGVPEVALGRSIASNKQRVQEGDVLLCKINPRINRVWRVARSSGRPQIASTEWIVLRGKAFDPDFLMWRLREATFREALGTTVSGVGGSLMRARPQEVANLEIPLPPLSEQRRIVARLEKLEARLRRARKALEEIPDQLAQARRALLAAAFRGDLTTVPVSGIHGEDEVLTLDGRTYELPRGWVWRHLSDCSSISGGLTKNPKRSAFKKTRPYLRVANVYANRLELEDVARIGVATDELEKVMLKRDDLLVVEGNGSRDQIGRVALWNGSIDGCVHQNHIIKARFASGIVPKFALFWFLSPLGRDFIERVAQSSSGLYCLSTGKVAALPLPIATIAEQREIVRRLERGLARLDAAAAAQAAAVADLDRLEQSLLAKAFLGALVPQDPTDEPAASLLARMREHGGSNHE